MTDRTVIRTVHGPGKGTTTMELSELGVSPETEARLEVFGSIDPPEHTAYDRSELITGSLTYGQVQILRGALRASVMTALTMETAHKAFTEMTGQPYEPVCEHGNGLETALGELLALEDILAGATAEIDAESVDFLVPDSLPTDFDAS